MLLREKIVNVGVGQCGSNYVSELEKLDFQSFYVNTSLEDLETINTDKKNKYHIKSTKGMAKNRLMAKQCILSDNNADSIAYAINDQYAMADIIMVYFSLSGGTGGTMANFIMEVIKDLFPDKIVNAVVIKGKSTEDIGLQANAIESLEHLKSLQKDGIVTQIHLLDNNSRENVFSINRDFALCFDKFVSFDEITTEGNLDEEEKEKMLVEPGMAVMLEFENEDFLNGLSEAVDNTFYVDWIKNPTLHGIILNNKQNINVNLEVIKDVLGMPKFTHSSTWEKQSNVLFATGMKFNDSILYKLNENAIHLAGKKRKMEEESIKSVDANSNKPTFDTASILTKDKTVNIKKSQQAVSSSRRRRGERNGSTALNKYKNM